MDRTNRKIRPSKTLDLLSIDGASPQSSPRGSIRRSVSFGGEDPPGELGDAKVGARPDSGAPIGESSSLAPSPRAVTRQRTLGRSRTQGDLPSPRGSAASIFGPGDFKHRQSLDSGSRRREATFFMRYMLGGGPRGSSSGDGPGMTAAAVACLKDSEGVRKPVVVEFLEKSMAAVLRKVMNKENMTMLECQELIARHEEKEKRAAEGHSDEDSDDSELDDPLLSEAVDLLHQLQDSLMDGTHVATLAGLLYTTTFSIRDKRIDDLIGRNVPVKIRDILMIELIKVIDNLWERFGMVLLEQFHSFSASFAELDKDGGGTIDRREFTKAYIDINMKAMAIEAGEPIDNLSQLTEEDSTPDLSPVSPSRPTFGRSKSMVVKKTPSMVDRQSVSHSGSPVSSTKQNVAKINRMILKTDADFLFDMLRTGERGLAKTGNEDDDHEVSMPSLVMRLTGLGEKTMERVRERILDKHSSLENAFHKYVHGEKLEMSVEEFEGMYLDTMGHHHRSDSIVKLTVLQAQVSRDTENKEKSKRIFNSIDIDGGGSVSIDELHHALAGFAPATTFCELRRKLLLRYGSYEDFFLHLTSGGCKSTDELIQQFIAENDLNHEDGAQFAEQLGLEQTDVKSVRKDVPPDGYTISEFAISLFLQKPEESTLEEVIQKLGYPYRDKHIPFKEFSERILGHNGGGRRASFLANPPVSGAKGNHRPAITKIVAMTRTVGRLAAPNKPGFHRPSGMVVAPTYLPVSCKILECRMVYEALQREHRRVSLNILMQALTNFSDVIALDHTTYQSGDRITCRVRLSNEAQKRCKEMPIVAVVPQRLEYKELGAKSYWIMDEEKVTDLLTVCERVHELPRSSNGSVLKEACMKIVVPFVLATDQRYEVRLFASSNGREPGKQIGKGVSFNLLMPRPQVPMVDQVSLNASNGEASVVLHWSPPLGSHAQSSPIVNFMLQVEPLIFRHEIVAEAFDTIDMDHYGAEHAGDNASDDGEVVHGDDNDEEKTLDDCENHGLQEVIVWSPALKGFTKKLSYRIDGLQRGVQYRFGVQCMHAGPRGTQGDSPIEIRGAPSELSDIVTMPLYNVTEAPGVPEASRRADGMIDIVWVAPADEGLSDSNRICNYNVQYRHTSRGDIETAESDLEGSDSSEQDPDAEKGSDKSSEGDGFDDGEKEWVTVDETSIFISQPKFVDFHGWMVPCHILALRPIGGDLDSRPHEFRICAVNYAGSSPWSQPSRGIALHKDRRENTLQQQAVSALEVVEVNGTSTPGEENFLRSQLVLRFSLPPYCDLHDMPKFTVLMRDASQHRGEGGWVSMDTYTNIMDLDEDSARKVSRRPSSARTHVRAVVMGLQRYPSFASLAVQVRATSASGTGTAEIQLEGLKSAPPSVPTKPPSVIQTLHPSVGAAVVELQWPHVECPKERKMQYVLQAARADKPAIGTKPLNYSTIGRAEAGKTEELEFGDFSVVADTCIMPGADGLVTCFARDIGPEGMYKFRIGIACQGETPLAYSPENGEPFELAERQAPSKAVALSPEEQVKQEADLRPKKPRDLQVLQAELGWCQLLWQQRLKIGGKIPHKYDVEQCKEDAPGEWQPVQSSFFSLEEVSSMDGNLCYNVKAAVFFGRSDDKEQVGQVLPRWQMRVRPQGCDWSQPSSWQQPPQPLVPARPSAPTLIRCEQQLFELEWTIPEPNGVVGDYEVQMQTQQQRRGGKVTDWTPVTAYTAPSANSTVIRALVERKAAADVAKACLSSPEDSIHFRVRIACDGGVTGQPSPPSEFVPIQMSLPPVPAPSYLELVGHGRLLMESKEGSALDAEFVRLEWPLGIADEDTEATTEMSGITYEIEAKTEENGFWAQMPGALIELDRRAGRASSLVPLPTASGVEEATFRVAVSRQKCGDVSYSEPSQAVTWGGAIELESPPEVIHALPTAVVIHFTLPNALARPGICRVSASLKIHRRKRRKTQCDEALPWELADESPVGGNESQRGADKRSPEQEDELYEIDDYDDAEELDYEAEVFEVVGEYLVSWRSLTSAQTGLAKSEGQTSSLPGRRTSVSVGLVMPKQKSALGSPCEAMLMLDRLLDSTHCVIPGDHVRVAIRVCAGGSGAGVLSDYSAATMVSERTEARCADLQLEYPSWNSMVSQGTVSTYTAALLAGNCSEYTESHALTWCREALRSNDGSQRVSFDISRGRLPKGLELDSESGRIWGMGEEDNDIESFTVRARVLRTWPGRAGAPVVIRTAASATLRCAVLEERFHDAIRDVFTKQSVVDELAYHGLSIARILHFVAKPDILSVNFLLQRVMTGAAGEEATMTLVKRILSCPSDGIIVAAELDEEEFMHRLFGEGTESSASSSRSSDVEAFEVHSKADSQADSQSDDSSVEQATSERARASGSIKNQEEILRQISSLSSEVNSNSRRSSLVEPIKKEPGSCVLLSKGSGSVSFATNPGEQEDDSRQSVSSKVSFTEKANFVRRSLAYVGKFAVDMSPKPGARQSALRIQAQDIKHLREAGSSNGSGLQQQNGSFSLVNKMAPAVNEESDGAQTSDSGDSNSDAKSVSLRISSRKKRETGKWRARGSSRSDNKRSLTESNRGSYSSPKSKKGSVGGDLNTKPYVDINYPTFTPLWPAFTDIEFPPMIKFYRKVDFAPHQMGEEVAPPDLGALLFSISPPLPANVQIDEVSGIISGSPLLEHVKGGQHIITVRWRDAWQVAGTCAVAFAVVTAEVASVCNAAYLGQEVPAFRSVPRGSPLTGVYGQYADAGLVADDGDSSLMEGHTEGDTGRDLRGQGEAPLKTGARPFMTWPSSALPRVMPPLHLDGEVLRGKAAAKPSRKGSSPNWKSKVGLTTSTSPGKASRTTVFPLGPPLRNRDPMDAKGMVSFMGQTSSTRPWLCELHDTRESPLISGPRSQGISTQGWRSFGATTTETRASTAPNSHICTPLGATSARAARCPPIAITADLSARSMPGIASARERGRISPTYYPNSV